MKRVSSDSIDVDDVFDLDVPTDIKEKLDAIRKKLKKDNPRLTEAEIQLWGGVPFRSSIVRVFQTNDDEKALNL